MFELLLVILLISISECTGTTCLKHLYLDKNKYWLFIVAILCYVVVCMLLLVSYRYKTMGMVNVIWSGMSILVILFAGVIFFKEEVTTYDKIGVILIVAGMAFILWETERDHFAHFRIFPT